MKLILHANILTALFDRAKYLLVNIHVVEKQIYRKLLCHNTLCLGIYFRHWIHVYVHICIRFGHVSDVKMGHHYAEFGNNTN